MKNAMRWRAVIASGAFIAAVALAGCSAGTSTEAEVGRDPASVVALGGPDNLHLITLPSDAAAHIGLTTAPVTAVTPSTANHHATLAIALAAVLYDDQGVSWVYVQKAPLSFERAKVVIATVDGDTALLTSGPAVGTQVVTVGNAELDGSEYGVPGE
jgi:hypothetical protein